MSEELITDITDPPQQAKFYLDEQVRQQQVTLLNYRRTLPVSLLPHPSPFPA